MTAKRKSTGQTIFEDLQEKIISGVYAAGTNLPSERDLVGSLGVSRSAVREALQRLSQSRLVTINHGGGTRVNDYRETAGLDLLSRLFSVENIAVDLNLFRSLIEMRSALAVDAARYAAGRRSDQEAEQIAAALEEMKLAESSSSLQKRTIQYWDLIISASQNIAYKLSMNSLKENYPVFERFGENFSIKNYKFVHYDKLTEAIKCRDQTKAELEARTVVDRDAQQLVRALQLGKDLPEFANSK